jgi:hypothetical protein
VPLKKTKRNRNSQEDNSQLLMPSSINLIDLDIPDYYSEAKVTLRLFSTSFLSKEIVSEKVIRMRELFQLSSLRNNRNEIKEVKTSEKEKEGKNSFSQCRFGWNSVKIPSPIRTEKSIRKSKLSPIALFSIFSTWNFLTTSSSTSTPPIDEIRTEKTESASKIKISTANLNSNLNLPVNDGNSVDGNCIDMIHSKNVPVEIFLRSRLVPVLSCVTLQSMDRFNIMNRTEKNGNSANNGNKLLVGGSYDNINNNNNKTGNNGSDDNGDGDGESDEIIDTNSNNNNNNTEPYNTTDPPLKNTANTENSSHTLTVEKQSELHFLVSTCNSAAARTVMSVLGEKKYLKAALLLTDTNSCNALDVALERGEECACVYVYVCLLHFI